MHKQFLSCSLAFDMDFFCDLRKIIISVELICL